MENCPQLMYNAGIVDTVKDRTNKVIGKRHTREMRSVLMEIMINEVASFCSTDIQNLKQLKEQVSNNQYIVIIRV